MSWELLSFFFFNDTATTEIYTLSLHDALPIFINGAERVIVNQLHRSPGVDFLVETQEGDRPLHGRSEEHTSELQSRQYLVCRLLLEKKKTHHATHCQHATATVCVKP